MKKLRSLKALKTEAWSKISSYVRQKEKGKCYTCGIVKDFREQHCGHYQHNTERNQLLGGNALWFDLRNLHCQCAGCNTYRGGALTEYSIKLETEFGTGILQEIRKLYYTYKKWTREEIQEIIDLYTQKIEEL